MSPEMSLPGLAFIFPILDQDHHHPEVLRRHVLFFLMAHNEFDKGYLLVIC